MSVESILQQMASEAANARLRQGAQRGSMIAGLSQVPGQIMADREQQRVLARHEAQQAEQVGFQRQANARANSDQILQDRLAAEAARRKQIVNAGLAAAAGDSGDPFQFDAKAAFAAVSQLGAPEAIQDVIAAHRELVKTTEFDPTKGAMDATGKIVREPVQDLTTGAYTGPDGIRYKRDGSPLTGTVMTPTPAPTKPPAVGSFEDYVVRKFGPQPTPDQVEAARKAYQQADDRPVSINMSGMGALYAATDPKAIAAGIADGSMSPDITQYGRAVQGAVATELRKSGFNLATAQTDWKATNKHIATMNGAQQLRLNQAINSLPDMLDSVDALASKWKGGRFPILNKANLALAKGGAYGPDVASVANQLDAQIADVTADLGNVYMGGNSPTDHALGLAGKSLKGEWDQKVLHDMVALAKKNVTIRRNSISNTGVAGASATNPYAAPQGATPPAAAGGVTVTSPSGKPYTFKTQAEADTAVAKAKAAGLWK